MVRNEPTDTSTDTVMTVCSTFCVHAPSKLHSWPCWQQLHWPQQKFW